MLREIWMLVYTIFAIISLAVVVLCSIDLLTGGTALGYTHDRLITNIPGGATAFLICLWRYWLLYSGE